MKPSSDPKADELVNSNISQSNAEVEERMGMNTGADEDMEEIPADETNSEISGDTPLSQLNL